MTNNTFKGVVQLSKEQYNELKTNGNLTVGQDTLTYDPNATLYVTDMFIYVPQRTSELINDSNFATSDAIPGIVDDLNSVDNTKSLSANQGRVLNEKITGILNNVAGGVQSFTVQTVSDLGVLFGLEITESADSFAVGSNTITYENKTYTLKNGDIFLIVDVGVPDYWFSLSDMTLYRLETNKINLDGYAKIEDIPTKTSQLENDSDFTTNSKLKEVENKIPTKVSELNNDSSFASVEYVDEKTNIDISGKLDKISSSGNWRTYAIDEDGEQDTLSVAMTEATANGGSIATYMASNSGTTTPGGKVTSTSMSKSFSNSLSFVGISISTFLFIIDID